MLHNFKLNLDHMKTIIIECSDCQARFVISHEMSDQYRIVTCPFCAAEESDLEEDDCQPEDWKGIE